MERPERALETTVDILLEAMPQVWDRIRFNLRTAAIGKFDISLEQFHTLRHIRKGYCHTGDLAEKLLISRPAVSQAVTALVAKGLVRRNPERGDRRLVRLELTPHAIRVLDANYEENRAWTKEKMAGLDPVDLECVEKAMRVLKSTFAPGEP